MQRLFKIKRYVDWMEPLHDIAREETGLADFGGDAYRQGLQVILEALDDGCDLNELGKYAAPIKLIHVLKQRLLAEQTFKDNPQILQNPITKPLVITGLVRTGSTALHYLMAQDPNRQHLQYWLAEFARPRPVRNEWEQNADFKNSKERLDMMYEVAPDLKAVHFMAPNWPEECGHLMAHHFTDDFWQCGMRAPYYNAWYETADLVPTYRQHKRMLQLIGSNEPDKPWLLKYPVHMKHLKSFLTVYPDAQVIWTHRDPAVVMSSYVSLIAGFRKLNVNTVDKNYILNEMLEIWASATERAMEVRKQYPQAQFYDMYFDDFINDSVGEVQKIYQHFGIEWTTECEAALQQWNRDNPQNKHGKHQHSMDEVSASDIQIRERFAKYIETFNPDR